MKEVEENQGSYPSNMGKEGAPFIKVDDIWSEYKPEIHLKKFMCDMKADFPFTDGRDGLYNIMRMKGYYSIAIPPYIAEAIRNWFNKCFGELENHTSPTKEIREET